MDAWRTSTQRYWGPLGSTIVHHSWSRRHMMCLLVRKKTGEQTWSSVNFRSELSDTSCQWNQIQLKHSSYHTEVSVYDHKISPAAAWQMFIVALRAWKLLRVWSFTAGVGYLAAGKPASGRSEILVFCWMWNVRPSISPFLKFGDQTKQQGQSFRASFSHETIKLSYGNSSTFQRISADDFSY